MLAPLGAKQRLDIALLRERGSIGQQGFYKHFAPLERRSER